ncbi:hypothetical protein F4809DRAFT_537146 [Biscogniauxia mediterranea]|nr:hypothetical protein F4809DRAFT_537146 [Biscogniauxia mediterranea]
MRFLAIITALLAAAPAVLSQTDGNWKCLYGNRDEYPKSSQPDGREARKLRRCFRDLTYRWETGTRCGDWWVVSRGHRWHNPHHCWKACYKCMDRAISDHQPEVYCDKYKVSARCIMSYRPWTRRGSDELGLDGHNNNGTSAAEEDEFPDMYKPEWENEDGDNVDWDDDDDDEVEGLDMYGPQWENEDGDNADWDDDDDEETDP